ncbi:MAG: polyprenyl synthetase family protein [candidate division Zixibacteria bacterium]|nr:polyprenyl synthetase family protein [candidate division Zixibacteria bacterium]
MIAGPSQSIPELQTFWDKSRRRVEAELDRRLSAEGPESARLFAAMRHAVLAGGKRLRPILAIAAFESLNGHDEAIDSVAAALEMLHTYSLVHDDLPCMDDDDQRRGRPTVHVAFDEATAVLAGDALHALAFEILARSAPPEVIVIVAQAVGPTRMVGGQMADLAAEGQVPTEELVRRIHERKTGALIVASVTAGALLAGAGPGVVRLLESYAHPLGLAFQIVDDVLELTRDAGQLGKPVGSDLKHAKVTYPAAVGMDAARRKAGDLVHQAKQALQDYPGDAMTLQALADFIIDRDR